MKNKLTKTAKATSALGVLMLLASLGKYQFFAAETGATGTSPFLVLGIIIAVALIIISIVLVAIAMSM